jgi:dTMP kinase
VIVEGARDVRALRALGLRGAIEPLNSGAAVFALCERLGRSTARAVILTDWDRRGGQLARRLRDGLAANGVAGLEDVRSRLARLTQKEIQDVESLDTLVARARAALEEGRTAGKPSKRYYAHRPRGRSRK